MKPGYNQISEASYKLKHSNDSHQTLVLTPVNYTSPEFTETAGPYHHPKINTGYYNALSFR